jgi:hypothetical protein
MNGRMILLGLALAGSAMAGETTNDAPALAAREAELAAGLLVQQNEALTSEAAKLREQVAQLTVSLAEAMAELDVERSRRPAEGNAGGEVVASETLEVADLGVVDVNRPLNMVVLSGGGSQGMKPGLRFTVVRDRKAIGRVRTIDVRSKIAGAVVEETSEGTFPEKGDRVILSR